jgi:hypothetical protein
MVRVGFVPGQGPGERNAGMQIRSISKQAGRVIVDSFEISFVLFKIMVPVLIAVRILQELDWIGYLAAPLGPMMKMVGLPQEMGLVWATALLNNLYSGVLVLLTLVGENPLTGAQATVLGTMMLVAHALPIELKIAQKSGARLIFQGFMRIGSALFIGWALHTFYRSFGFLQSPASTVFHAGISSGPTTLSWGAWFITQLYNLVFIYFIILGLLILMRTLKKMKILEVMDRVLRPLLRLMGIGPKASGLTIIGLTLGISYGGALIIHEARSHAFDKKDAFYSLTFMGLCHSLIEDTLLMVMIGGHLSGLLWGRLLFAVLAVSLLVRFSSRPSQTFGDTYLWREPK